MPISADCGHCGATYRVSSKFAGKSAKCKKCGKNFLMPAGATSSSEPIDTLESDDAPCRTPVPARPEPTDARMQYYRRKVTFVPLGSLAAALAVFWGLFLAKILFDVDLLSRGREKAGDGVSATFYLWFALAGTVLVAPIVLFKVKRGLYLLEHGIETDAEVVSAGLLGKGKGSLKGQMPVTFSFTVDGKEYKVRKDVLASTARTYTTASRIPVRYDPRNPKRCVILD
jgi:hypothetical protein